MKILFVEDTDMYVEMYKPQLEKLGEVIHFKSANAALRSFDEHTYDLIVCDHYILRFEEELNSRAEGNEVYWYTRHSLELETPFIHFSTSPCPKAYDASDDKNFHSHPKKYEEDMLIGFIKEIL